MLVSASQNGNNERDFQKVENSSLGEEIGILGSWKLSSREENKPGEVMLNCRNLKIKNVHDALAKFTEVAGPSSGRIGTMTN
eukprot:2416904-Pleurochrysis_carterae.AAC.2